MLGCSQCSPLLGCPGAPHLRFFSSLILLWLTALSESTETVLGGHWWPSSRHRAAGMQVRPGGNRRPLVSDFRPSSCLHYMSGLLCVRFLHFRQVFPFPTVLHFLTQGLRSSDITARCLSAHIPVASLCALGHSQSLPPLDGGKPKPVASCSAFSLLPLTVPHGKRPRRINKDTS